MKRETWEIIGLIVLIPFVIITLWVYLIHEPTHYITGTIQGRDCTITLPFPLGVTIPYVLCKNVYSFSAPGMFLLSMMPHLLDLFVVAAFIKTKNKFIRLIPYTAFFDIHSSLSIPIIVKTLGGAGFGDGFVLLRRMYMFYPEYSGIAALLLYAIIVLSIAIFYGYYRSDFTEHKDRRFLKAAFLIFLVNIVLSILAVILFVSPWMKNTG